MAKFKMSDLVEKGRNAPDNERWEPPAGESFKVEVKEVRTDENNDGTPRWGVWVEVISGEHKGKRFWKNIKFSLEWDFINKMAVDALEGFGLSSDFLASDPEPEAVALALTGKKAVITAGYKNGKGKNKDKKYEEHTVSRAKSDAPPPPPADEADDDDWDDED